MILAAGRGERMRPLSDTTPKPLLEAGGKALIVWQLERLVAADFRDIVVNVAHQGEAAIEHRVERIAFQKFAELIDLARAVLQQLRAMALHRGLHRIFEAIMGEAHLGGAIVAAIEARKRSGKPRIVQRSLARMALPSERRTRGRGRS